MAPKKRKYDAEYIKYSFVAVEKNGVEVPQCVVCLDTLSNDALRLTRLQRHLHHRHPELSKKPVEYFSAKRDSLSQMRLDKKGKYNQETAKDVKVSYEIAMLIAKNKKPHTIGENLVKPCIVNAVKILLGDDIAKQFKNISLSDSTVKRRIDELADDIKQQVLEKVKCSPFFAISCDESTDQANCAQLIVYARFIANNTIEEELLFSEPLKTTTKGADVFQAVSQFFEVNGLMWEKLVGVCTDGAPAMLGSRSGFVKMVKSKNPSIFAMHCVIHRQALVAKTLPDDLREDLNFAVEVVNYVKSSALNTRLFAALCESLNADHMVLLYHTEVRWLSKGNMLGRIYELREAVAEFLEQRGRRTMCRAFKSEHFQFSLAYLADIFEALNSLNLKLQGANANVMAHYDIVQSFIAKISLWLKQVERGNLTWFSRLNELFSDKCLCEDLKRKIKGHLRGLQDEFFHYFPDVEPQNLIYKLVRNPFLVNVEDLPHDLQEEAIELQFNNLAKDSFESMPLENFWVKLQAEYPKISSQSLRILVPFSSTYLCETGFSALMTLNTQHRNRLRNTALEHGLARLQGLVTRAANMDTIREVSRTLERTKQVFFESRQTRLNNVPKEEKVKIVAEYGELAVKVLQVQQQADELLATSHVPTSSTTLPPPVNNSKLNSTRSIPKLPTFDGDILQFKAFWDQFNAAVHQREDLKDVTKFMHLRSCLAGPALHAITGVTTAAKNYPAVVQLLHDRFYRVSDVLDAHILKIFSVTNEVAKGKKGTGGTRCTPAMARRVPISFGSSNPSASSTRKKKNDPRHEQSLRKDPAKQREYTAVIEEYLRKGWAEEIADGKTKCRVVFDGSAKYAATDDILGNISVEVVCDTEHLISAVFFCKLRNDPAYLTAGIVHVSFANCVANGYVAQALRSVGVWLEGDEL
ncbi:Protein ZBED8 [Trichinella zimbabwensis]|uniref:Protein ZBED8 n=1 Tax=Trichinella zimbabwensis TaxID=268475 RepID=A0A0V1HTX1_9BILA|nr:Protein ZBED8 [Trichinella zimbabwensis]